MSDQPPITIPEFLDRYERAFGRASRERVELGIQAIHEQRERERQARLAKAGKKRGRGMRSIDEENERFMQQQRVQDIREAHTRHRSVAAGRAGEDTTWLPSALVNTHNHLATHSFDSPVGHVTVRLPHDEMRRRYPNANTQSLARKHGQNTAHKSTLTSTVESTPRHPDAPQIDPRDVPF